MERQSTPGQASRPSDRPEVPAPREPSSRVYAYEDHERNESDAKGSHEDTVDDADKDVDREVDEDLPEDELDREAQDDEIEEGELEEDSDDEMEDQVEQGLDEGSDQDLDNEPDDESESELTQDDTYAFERTGEFAHEPSRESHDQEGSASHEAPRTQAMEPPAEAFERMQLSKSHGARRTAERTRVEPPSAASTAKERQEPERPAEKEGPRSVLRPTERVPSIREPSPEQVSPSPKKQERPTSNPFRQLRSLRDHGHTPDTESSSSYTRNSAGTMTGTEVPTNATSGSGPGASATSMPDPPPTQEMRVQTPVQEKRFSVAMMTQTPMSEGQMSAVTAIQSPAQENPASRSVTHTNEPPAQQSMQEDDDLWDDHMYMNMPGQLPLNEGDDVSSDNELKAPAPNDSEVVSPAWVGAMLDDSMQDDVTPEPSPRIDSGGDLEPRLPEFSMPGQSPSMPQTQLHADYQPYERAGPSQLQSQSRSQHQHQHQPQPASQPASPPWQSSSPERSSSQMPQPSPPQPLPPSQSHQAKSPSGFATSDPIPISRPAAKGKSPELSIPIPTSPTPMPWTSLSHGQLSPPITQIAGSPLLGMLGTPTNAHHTLAMSPTSPPVSYTHL